jgi:hypothetical protein
MNETICKTETQKQNAANKSPKRERAEERER